MMRTLALVLVLGCGGKPATHVDGPPPVTTPLELTFQTFSEAGSGQRPVAMGSTLHTGDRIALSVSVTRPAYIYVLQRFPDGKAGVLFPGQGEERALSGTQRIPGTGWFELDQVVGEENVYVVASTERLAQADAAVQHAVDDVRSSGHAPLVPAVPTGPDPLAKSNVTEPKAGSDMVGAAVKHTPSGEMLASRGLTRVEADSSIHATADAHGIAVFRFSFAHVAR